MGIKPWPVDHLLRAVVAEHDARVSDEPMFLTDEQRAESCRACGHHRSQHPGGYPGHVWDHCISTVGGYWREPCTCREWVAPEG